MQVLPKQNPEKLHRIDVDVMVKERPMETTEVETEWQIAPGDSGRPGLVGIVPGAPLHAYHACHDSFWQNGPRSGCPRLRIFFEILTSDQRLSGADLHESSMLQLPLSGSLF